MIDFNASQLPSLPNPNDYMQMNDGTFQKKTDVYNDPNTVFIDPNAGFLASEGNQLKNNLYSQGNGLLALMGNENALNKYKQQTAISNAYSKPYDSIEGVNGFGDATKYLGHQVIQALPTLGLAAASGGVGGFLGGVTSKSLLGGAVDSALASRVGSLAGQFAVNAGLSAGQTGGEQLANGNQDALQNALLSGVVGGTLGTFADQNLLGNLGKFESRGANALTGAALNAGVGVSQTYLDNNINGRETTNNNLLDAGIGGALIGGLAGSLHKGDVKENNKPIEQNKQIESNNNQEKEAVFENTKQSNINTDTDTEKLNNNINNPDKSASFESNNIYTKDNIEGKLSNPDFLNKLNLNENAKELYAENPSLVEETYKSSRKNFDEKIKELYDEKQSKNEQQNTDEINKPLDETKTTEDKLSNENLDENTSPFNDLENTNEQIKTYTEDKLHTEEKQSEIKPLDETKNNENNVVFSEDKTLETKPLPKDYNEIIKDKKENIELTNKDQSDLNRVNDSIKNISNKVNIDVEVLHEKHSPFDSSKKAWFDPSNNKIYVVSGKESSEQFKNLLSHELFHNGLYKMLKGDNLEGYSKEMNRLYENKEVGVLTDKLMNDFGYDKPKAVEEALARIVQNGGLENLPMKNRIFNYFKNLVNKLLGREELVSNQDVKDFISKVDKYNYKDNSLNQDNINHTNNLLNNHTTENNKQIMFSELSPEEMKKSENETFSPKLMDTVRDALNSGISDQKIKEFGNSGSVIENFSNLCSLQKEKFSNEKNYKNAMKDFFGVLRTTRDIVENSGFKSIKTISHINDSREQIGGSLSKVFGSKTERTKLQSKGITDKEIKIVTDLMAHNSYNENEGKGIRVTGDAFAQQLREKNISESRIELLNKYQNNIRETLDSQIRLSAYQRAQPSLNMLENILLKSEHINDKILPDFKYLQSEILNGNHDNFENLINNFFNTNKDELLKSSDNIGIEGIKKDISNEIKLSKDSIDNGYIPKLHQGKYTLNLNLHGLDDSGEEKQHTLGVYASDDKKELVAIHQKMTNKFIEMAKNGEISPEELNKIKLEFSERSGDIDGLSPERVLSSIEKSGTNISPELKRELLSGSKQMHNELQRKFLKGAGYNTDIEQIAAKTINSTINKIKSNHLYNDEVSTMNSINNPIEKNLARDIQDRFSRVEDSNTSTSKLRGLTSMFTLSLNAASFFGQAAQFLQAAPVHISQYTGTTGLHETTSKMVLAAKYLKDGTTGNIEYDNAIKNFNHPMLDAQQSKMLFDMASNNTYSRNSTYNKIKHFAYAPMEKIEMINRLSNFMNSHDIYKSATEGKLKGRNAGDVLGNHKDFNDFALNMLVKINGDYSSGNKPKIFNTDIGKTFGMFQMWKVVMGEQFKNLDGRGKAYFAGSILLTAGLRGMPFEQDLEEIIDTISQASGGKPIAKDFVNNFLQSAGKSLGTNGDLYLEHGMFPALGTRIGIGDVIPGLKGVSELVSGVDSGKALQDIGGPAIGTIVNAGAGLNALGRGDIATALRKFSPTAIKNVIKGGQEFNDGYSISDDGTKRISKSDSIDALIHCLGLYTPDMQKQTETSQKIQDFKNDTKHIENTFKTEWMQAKMEGNKELTQEIQKNALAFGINETKDKSGYGFIPDISGWNKEFIQAKTSAVQRGNINSSKQEQVANRENLGIDLSRKEI